MYIFCSRLVRTINGVINYPTSRTKITKIDQLLSTQNNIVGNEENVGNDEDDVSDEWFMGTFLDFKVVYVTINLKDMLYACYRYMLSKYANFCI